MKVLLLGGYGQFGLPTAQQLVRDDLVDEIVIAGRDPERAQQAALALGRKARPLQLDTADVHAVEAALDGVRVMVSFMWRAARHQEPLLGAALRAGAHYCALGGPSPSAEQDEAARAAGLTALIGVGLKPGFADLVDKLAFSLLDDVDMALSNLFWPPLQAIWLDLYRAYYRLPGGLDRGPHGGELATVLAGPASDEARLRAIRDGRVVEMWLHLLSQGEPEEITIPRWRGGELVTVDPLAAGADTPLEGGGFASLPVIMLDRATRFGAPYSDLNAAGFTQTFTDLLHDAAARVRGEEHDFESAARFVHGQLDAGLDDYLLDPALFAAVPGYSMSVYGRKEGKRARAAAWIPQAYFDERNWFDLTAANVAVSVARLLRGDIGKRGAFRLPEADTLDDAYIAEVTSRLPYRPEGVALVGRRLES